jgi:hypothetical protein
MRVSVLGCLVAGLIAACGTTPQPTETVQMRPSISPTSTTLIAPASVAPTNAPFGAATTTHLSIQDLDLDYPSEWDAVTENFPAMGGFGQPLAVLGTVSWEGCAEGDINCYYQRKLDPGQISVTISDVLLPINDLCELGKTRPDIAARGSDDPRATGSLLRVDGRPTLRTDYDVGQTDYYQSDEWRTWEIAEPGTIKNAFVIDSRYRGPDLDDLRGQLDQMIASITIGKTSTGYSSNPSDCGPPFPG